MDSMESPKVAMEKQELDLNYSILDIIGVLFRWRKQILIMVGAAMLLSVVVSLLLPNYYTAATTIIPANEDKTLFGTDGKNNSLYGDDDAVDRAIIFASSTPLIEFMIKEFDLAKRYGIDASTPKGEAKVIKRFRKLYNIKKNEHSGIEISLQDKDPEMAAKMVLAIITKLESLYKEVTAPNKDLIVQTYEGALQEKKEELNKVSDTLMSLRSKYTIYDVKQQGELLSALMVETEADLAENQAKLSIFKAEGGKRDSIVNISAKVQGLSRKLELLKMQSDSVRSAANLYTYNQGREQILYYENQVKGINEDITAMMTNYAQFKAQANSKASAIITLEPVQVPKIKSYPVRSIMVIGAAMLAMIVGVLMALVLDLNKRIDWKSVLNG